MQELTVHLMRFVFLLSTIILGEKFEADLMFIARMGREECGCGECRG
jgi:hypothetical protein